MKLGIIVPSSNTTMEAEVWKMVSGWSTVHTARMRLREITVDDLEKMEGQMLDAACSLADAGVDVIGYGCTSGSLFKGKDHDTKIEREIERKTKVPSVATAKAVVEALDSLQINRVCVATPYLDEINERVQKYLEQNKIEVLRILGLGITRNSEVGNQHSDLACELARKAHVPEAQGIFISCTNFKTIETIGQLEEELKVPVISSNTATLWAMMRKAATQKALKGYGKLLSR
ncbi:MAG: aspartate/glutamate racemase family protein [Candidatus Aminicenantes bacterium]|nr:MAG: aspartate/glutamate racemase family protein [Candidatus Aminicenantes bacterium]